MDCDSGRAIYNLRASLGEEANPKIPTGAENNGGIPGFSLSAIKPQGVANPTGW